MKPWQTSNEIIESIKRKIAVPISQVTFSTTDILSFVNEEMQISQVPSILSYNEEYFVYADLVALRPGRSRYSIPSRAIGMKLRDIKWQDTNGNLFPMTRIDSDNKDMFQNNNGSPNGPYTYYLENNDVVLSYENISNANGYLVMFYFRRPNQLVANERAAILSRFAKKITIANASIVAGNTLTIGSKVFTAVAGSPSSLQFQIGATSAATTSNLSSAINSDGTYAATASSDVLIVDYIDLDTEFATSNSVGFAINSLQSAKFDSIPDNISNGSVIDILQTNPGHKFLSIDVTLSNNAISGDYIDFSSLPEDMIVGDYICLSHECIIPQIPPDLHTGLTERAGARILAALGDQIGLQASNAKIAEIDRAQGMLVDNRVDGSPQKVLVKNSLLRLFKNR